MILVIDMCYKKNSLNYYEFVKPVTDIIDKTKVKYFVKHFSEIKNKDINRAEKIIICGVALQDSASKNYAKFKWIKNINKPILGICSGMQIIGKLYGAKIIKCCEIGVNKIDIIKENNLINEKKVYELHNYAVTLPKNFIALAKNKNCLQAIKHKIKEIYGVMFHPEVLNKKVIERFID